MYYAIVQSSLLYGVIAWGSTYSSYIQPLQVMQNKILKFMFGFNWLYCTEQLYRDLGLFDIRSLFFYQLAIFLFKIKHTFTNVCGYDTRFKSNNCVTIQKANTSHFKRHASALLPKVNNKLPKEIHTITNILKYKKCIKGYLLGNIHITESLDL